MPVWGEIIAELLTQGVRIKGDITKRKGGAGPSEGCTLLVNEIPVNVPVDGSYAKQSSYVVKKINGIFFLFRGDIKLFSVGMVPRPKFYDYVTSDGIAYDKIALLHGKDCLATTVFQKCIYWNSDKRCKFCGIELSLNSKRTTAVKTPAQLAEVAGTAKETDGIGHVVMTTGCTGSLKHTIRHLCDCIYEIKAFSGLPVHVQIEPPNDPSLLNELKDAGLDTIGLHIESFDEEILAKMAPIKSEIGLKWYTKAWEVSVDLFGKNQVSSFLIVGLGETKRSIIKGAEYLAKLGVYPFVVPLRPIPGSLMENAKPPESSVMVELCQEVGSILHKYNLSSKQNKAGCVRCGACSALPEFEI